MASRKRARTKVPTVKRTGKPFTVYLNDNLSNALATASEQRKVKKCDIVRVAVERLLNEMEAGQLDLPLGI